MPKFFEPLRQEPETSGAADGDTPEPEKGSALGKVKAEAEQKPEPEVKPAPEPPPPPVELKLEDIKLPEGIKAEDISPELFASFSKIVADPQLAPKDRAQQLVDLHQKALTDAAGEPYRQWEQTQDTWVNEIAKDKDIGSGDPRNPLKPELRPLVAKAIDKLGGNELRAALEFTGAGNNPVIAKAFVQISKVLTEGGHFGGSPGSQAPKSVAERMYPHLAEKET